MRSIAENLIPTFTTTFNNQLQTTNKWCGYTFNALLDNSLLNGVVITTNMIFFYIMHRVTNELEKKNSENLKNSNLFQRIVLNSAVIGCSSLVFNVILSKMTQHSLSKIFLGAMTVAAIVARILFQEIINKTPANTEKQKAEQPKAEQVKADQPTAEQSKAQQPTAEQPTAEQPTAEQPKAEQPTADQPTADQPTADQPTADQPTADQPTAEQPTAEQSKAGQPTAEQPTAEQPKAEQPKAEQPTAEQPKAEQSKAGQPTAEQPKSDQPPKIEKQTSEMQKVEQEKLEKMKLEAQKKAQETQQKYEAYKAAEAQKAKDLEVVETITFTVHALTDPYKAKVVFKNKEENELWQKYSLNVDPIRYPFNQLTKYDDSTKPAQPHECYLEVSETHKIFGKIQDIFKEAHIKVEGAKEEQFVLLATIKPKFSAAPKPEIGDIAEQPYLALVEFDSEQAKKQWIQSNKNTTHFNKFVFVRYDQYHDENDPLKSYLKVRIEHRNQKAQEILQKAGIEI